MRCRCRGRAAFFADSMSESRRPERGGGQWSGGQCAAAAQRRSCGPEAARGRRAEGKGGAGRLTGAGRPGTSRPCLTPAEEAPSSRPARSSAQRPARARFGRSSITAAVSAAAALPRRLRAAGGTAGSGCEVHRLPSVTSRGGGG